MPKQDSFLLKNKVNERSVSHKLGEYLQQQFPDWNVDCEYNKKGDATKILDGMAECRDSLTDLVYPDIIVHKRDTNENLLIVEMETKQENHECDRAKCELFTSNKGEYKI